MKQKADFREEVPKRWKEIMLEHTWFADKLQWHNPPSNEDSTNKPIQLHLVQTIPKAMNLVLDFDAHCTRNFAC